MKDAGALPSELRTGFITEIFAEPKTGVARRRKTMLRGVALLASLGALLLACQASPGQMNGEPSIRGAELSVEQMPWYGPIAGMPHAQAAAIFIRNRPALLRLPGVTKVTLDGQGILVQTDQPDRLPADVEGLPVLDIRDAIRLAHGVLLWNVPPTGGGRNEAPAPASLCQTLPEKSLSADVALYVAKAPDRSGIVCVRAVNGTNEGVSCGGLPFWLQKKEAGAWSDVVFPDTPPLAAGLGEYILQAGGSLDSRLPGFGRIASPGLYRACFRFWLAGQSEAAERCSQEFSLP